jgi:hypothetical protein
VNRVGEARGLTAEDCLRKSTVEEDILHVELLNGSVTGDSSGEHRAIKGPVSTELVREDPLADDNVRALRSGNQLPGPIADQGSVLFLLHSRTSMGISKSNTSGGGNQGWCR